MKIKKLWAYLVVSSSYPGVKEKEIVLYKRSRGPECCETVFNFKTGKCAGGWTAVKMGRVWHVDGKLQFEEPPAPSGELTKRMLSKKYRNGLHRLHAKQPTEQLTLNKGN